MHNKATYKHFVTFVFCLFCILLQLHYVLFAFCYICNLSHLHFVGFAFCLVCIMSVFDVLLHCILSQIHTFSAPSP